jgi:hypothetical protein
VTRCLSLGLLLLAGACGHSSQENAPGAVSSAVAASASVGAVASAVPSASVAAKTSAPQTWKGSYKTAPGTLTVPPDLSKTHWSSSDTTTGVGDGTMLLTVDPATHRVTGTLDGAIGAAVVDGLLGDAQLSASVRRRDPTDKGLAGTLLATVSADKITGTLTLASGDGATLRTGTFTLAPDGH